MSKVKGISADSPFVHLLGDLSMPEMLGYVHKAWQAYAEAYKDSAPPLQKRSEPELTQALAAYLRGRQEAGEQAFPGDFHGELSEFILDKNGLPKCIARTDIEWRLFG